MKPITLAYSPCPNDTFMFCAVATEQITSPGLTFDIRLHDIQTLNEHLKASVFDVSKVSFPAYFRARETYKLLEAGLAMGFGCGPVVVARSSEVLEQKGDKTVAVPGALTTANLLLHLWRPDIAERVFVRYDQIIDLVLNGQVDAGVIIHESRFVYHKTGLVLVVDLGDWWEQKTGLPLPLGGIVARRSLGEECFKPLESLIRNSIIWAQHKPGLTTSYVNEHARETSQEIQEQHINTFVNEFSINPGDEGHRAIDRLSEMAIEKGVPGF